MKKKKVKNKKVKKVKKVKESIADTLPSIGELSKVMNTVLHKGEKYKVLPTSEKINDTFAEEEDLVGDYTFESVDPPLKRFWNFIRDKKPDISFIQYDTARAKKELKEDWKKQKLEIINKVKVNKYRYNLNKIKDHELYKLCKLYNEYADHIKFYLNKQLIKDNEQYKIDKAKFERRQPFNKKHPYVGEGFNYDDNLTR